MEKADPPPEHPSIVGPQGRTIISLPYSESEFRRNPNEGHVIYHQVCFSDNSNDSSSQNAIITGSGTPPLGSGLSLGLNYTSFTEHARFLTSNNYNDNPVDLSLGLGLGNSHETRRFERWLDLNIADDSDTNFEKVDGEDDGNRGFGGVTEFDRPLYCWDDLAFNDQGSSVVDVEIRDQERASDAGSVVNGFCDHHYHDHHDDADDDVVSPMQLDTDVTNAFDTYQLRVGLQEFAIDTHDEYGGGGDEAVRDLDWEVFMAFNELDQEYYDMDLNVDIYEVILGEMEDQMNEMRGNPPAAEYVIQNLSSVRLDNKDEVCAICRDEVSGEQVLKQLPCSHCYHGECIFPWLRIRNTCPVCRFELPTDDAEYENHKWQREREMEIERGFNINDDLEIMMSNDRLLASCMPREADDN